MAAQMETPALAMRAISGTIQAAKLEDPEDTPYTAALQADAIEALCPAAWIVGRSDGLFVPVNEHESGAVLAHIMLVREPVFDPMEEAGEVVDAIGWEEDRPGAWWTLNGTAYIGEHELRRSWWEQTPARMVSTPAAYLDCHGAAFCIIDWEADVDAILGPTAAVTVDNINLASRLRRTMFDQAAPRRRYLESAIQAYPITVERRRAAA